MKAIVAAFQLLAEVTMAVIEAISSTLSQCLELG